VQVSATGALTEEVSGSGRGDFALLERKKVGALS
jgi:hypothetical protein